MAELNGDPCMASVKLHHTSVLIMLGQTLEQHHAFFNEMLARVPH